MGIDIYTKWDGMTSEEHEAQLTGFSIVHGHVGYLREAYHGSPYATRVLVPEAFEVEYTDEPESGWVSIPASTLRKRLPDAIEACIKRHKLRYDEVLDQNSPPVQSYKDFVDLVEQKELLGKHPKIYASY